MKKYTIIYLLLFSGIVILFPSCNNPLDVESINAISPKDFISDSKTNENAITAAYVLSYRAITQHGAWAYYSDVRSGFNKASGSLNTIFENQNLFAINPEMEIFRNWNRYYDAIAQCNFVIDELGKTNSEFLSADEINQSTGEALFLRAYLYFYISRIWGDVPLVLKSGVESKVASTKKSDVLAQVISDLDKAEKLVPDYLTDANGGENLYSSRRRVTRAAVLALIARVALETGDFGKGISAFENFELIEDNKFDLERINTINNVYRGNSNENIFGFQQADDFFSDNYNPYLKTIMEGGNEMKMILPDTLVVNNLFSENDARRARFFDEQNIPVTVQKFDPNYMVISRYGELVLTASELYLNNGNTTKSLELLNRIRNRASLETLDSISGQQLWGALKTERVRELFAEGQSFFDFIRWKETALRVPEITQEQVNSGIELWPLSRESRSRFFNVSQNSYWNSK